MAVDSSVVICAHLYFSTILVALELRSTQLVKCILNATCEPNF